MNSKLKKLLYTLGVLGFLIGCYYIFVNPYDRYRIEKKVFGAPVLGEDEQRPTNVNDTPLSNKYWYRGMFD